MGFLDLCVVLFVTVNYNYFLGYKLYVVVPGMHVRLYEYCDHFFISMFIHIA